MLLTKQYCKEYSCSVTILALGGRETHEQPLPTEVQLNEVNS